MGNNKNTFFVLLIAVLIAAAIGTYYFTDKPKAPPLPVSFSNSQASNGNNLQYFGYWPIACSPHPACTDVFADHVNMIYGSSATDFEYARTHNLKILVTYSFFEPVPGSDHVLTLPDGYQAKWDSAGYKGEVGPYINNVAAFMIADEPNLWATSGPNAGAHLSDQLDTIAKMIKKDFPNVPIAVDLHPMDIEEYLGPTRIPSNIDWVGFDWDPWITRCANPNNPSQCMTLEQALNKLETKITPSQKIFMVPDGKVYKPSMVSHGWTLQQATDDLLSRINYVYNLAQTHPRVVALIPYTWGSVPSDSDNIYTNSLPAIRARYQEIGSAIKTRAANLTRP